MADARQAGTIYDLGYQRYGGRRLGRSNAQRTLIGYSFRAAFGLGRGARAKLLPFVVTIIVFLPAIVTVGVASATGNAMMVNYANHLRFTAFLLFLFAAAQAPELVVTDKQQGVLALYLSRPITAADYALAKMIALTGAMLVVTLGPQTLMFVGKVMLSTTPWPVFKTEYHQLWPILGGTVVTSIFIAGVGLALSSLTSRRAYANASVIAFFLLLPAAATVIRSLATGNAKRYVILANPILVITGFTDWLFEVQVQQRSTIARADLPGQSYLYVMIAVTAIAMAVLIARYRKHTA